MTNTCRVKVCERMIHCKGLCHAHYNRVLKNGREADLVSAIDSRPPHGFRYSNTYRSWQMMKNRCSNPNAEDFSYYGGRGINFPKKWEKFLGFLQDMGEAKPGQTLERIDGGKNYSKKNCKWASRKDQSRNRNYCKLNIKKAREIRKLHKAGVNRKKIAKRYNISLTTFHSVMRGETWREA